MSDPSDRDDDDQKARDQDPAWFAKLIPAERPKAQDLLDEIDRVLARMLKNAEPGTPRPK